MLLYTGNQVSLFVSIEALKRHFASRKILVAAVVALLGRIVGVEKICPLRNYEFFSVIFFFLDINFATITANIKLVVFWINYAREFCLGEVGLFYEGCVREKNTLFEFSLGENSALISTGFFISKGCLREISILGKGSLDEDSTLVKNSILEVSIVEVSEPEGNMLFEMGSEKVSTLKGSLGEVSALFEMGSEKASTLESSPGEVSIRVEISTFEISILGEGSPREASILDEVRLGEF